MDGRTDHIPTCKTQVNFTTKKMFKGASSSKQKEQSALKTGSISRGLSIWANFC